MTLFCKKPFINPLYLFKQTKLFLTPHVITLWNWNHKKYQVFKIITSQLVLLIYCVRKSVNRITQYPLFRINFEPKRANVQLS